MGDAHIHELLEVGGRRPSARIPPARLASRGRGRQGRIQAHPEDRCHVPSGSGHWSHENATEQEAWDLLQEAQAAEAASECDKACRLYRRAFRLDPKLERMC